MRTRSSWIWCWIIGAVLASGAGAQQYTTIIENLPTCTGNRNGRVISVSDAVDDSDCSVGGATGTDRFVHQCICDTLNALGPYWKAVGGGGAGVTDGDKGDITVASSGAAWTVDADAIALGTDTTGNYAGSSSEGGAATTATALAANGANCSAGSFPLGVDASGTAESCTVAGTIGGSTGATDNAVLAADGTGGATLQTRAITISDVAGFIVTLASTPGNALALVATPPAATTGASQAGKAASLTASDAVASLDTAGAAAGGSVTITAGAAARNTSGNANGGNITLAPGAGIGTGTAGQVMFPGLGSSSVPELAFGFAGTGLSGGNDYIRFVSGGGQRLFVSSTAFNVYVPIDGQAQTFVGFIRKIEANTAGSGSPNILTNAESWKLLTNEGSSAKNYHTLGTAATGGTYSFCVQDADGVRIVANTADTIRVIDKATAAAGYIESTTIGSCVNLVALNAVEWFATSITGTWTDGTWSYDDTSLTTP